MYTRKAYATREAPRRGRSDDQPEAREGQAGRPGVAERFVVPLKPGNSGGGKGPQFRTDAIRGDGPGDWATYQTPKSVQKLQMTLHAKAKAEAGYRFYALYDKISREDILAHAYAQCRSKGRTGCGRSGFCGHRRVRGAAVAWRTGACAQAGDLPTGTHQKSVHTEGQRQAQAAGHLNLAGSGLHDSSDAGAGADLRSRPSTRAIRLPSRAKRPTGGGRGGGAAVPGSSGSR